MKKIKDLEQKILECKKLYYTLGEESPLSDEEYDKLENELRDLDPKNWVLSIVGTQFFNKEKVKHDKKMLSLDKKYEVSELIKWMGKEECLSLFKIDGLSCSVLYKNGNLFLAKTRGDGEFGENITENIFNLGSIRKNISLNTDLEIRGEIYCSNQDFNLLVDEMKSRKLDTPKSQRNIVSGILGRKDNIDLSKFLSFIAFDVIGIDFKTEVEKMEFLKNEGFNISEYKVIKNENDLKKFIDKTQDFMQNGNFLIDGAVFVINNVNKHEELGYTGHHPKFKMAFKFDGETKETTLEDISWQISRFGVYTPVANVTPVELSGATISNITLHNLKNVKNFNLKSGDVIKIIRSGEVIPKFLSVVTSKDGKCVIPKKCYYCSEKLVEEDVRLICNNEKCVGRKFEYVLNFVQKIGIEDLSDKRLLLLMDNNLVSDVEDIFSLKKEDLLKLPKIKEKMADKILANIDKVKNVNIIKFFDSLNFTGGSKKNTELCLENGIDSFEKFFSLTTEDLLKIKGFAEIKAKNYVKSIQENKKLISKLIELGFKVEFPSDEKKSAKLDGMTFCITGELSMARKEFEKLIKENGGSLSSSVSKKTTELITNETNSTSSKFVKAQELGVPVISENEFLKKYSLI